MAESISELRQMTDEELIRHHDKLTGNTVVRTAHNLQELARWDAVRQGNRSEGLTQTMTRLTWIITIRSVINVTATVVAVLG